MADKDRQRPQARMWLSRRLRSNVVCLTGFTADVGSSNEPNMSGQDGEISVIEFMLNAQNENKSAVEIAELLEAEFEMEISPLEAESKLLAWKSMQSAWQKHWTIVFKAVDELVESGAQCRLSAEGRVLSDEEIHDLRECFCNPFATDKDDLGEKSMDPDGDWDVVDLEDENSARLPRIDIEVLESTGPWTSIKTFTDGMSFPENTTSVGPTSTQSSESLRNVESLDSSFKQFENAISRADTTKSKLLHPKNEGVHFVYQDMQRLVLGIQKATNSSRPMSPAALFLYLRSFMPIRSQETPDHTIKSRMHTLPSSTSGSTIPKHTTNKPAPTTSTSFDWSHHILIDKNDMSATTVLRTLLLSVANNFAGLDDIPTSTILTHLRQTPSALSLLRNILKLPGHVPRALADNLLKASVQAQDVEAAALLLSLRDKATATNINEVRAKTDDGRHASSNYSSEGRKSMPKTLLEQASSARNVEMVEILLAHGADPNYTIPGHWDSYSRHNRGALAAVVGGDPRMLAGWGLKLERKDDTTLRNGMTCARMLFEAGAKFPPTIVDNAVANGEIGLAVLLGMNVAPKQHRTMMSHDMVVKLVRYCETEEEAVELFRRWDWMCKEVKCGECAERYGKRGLTWVLIEACRRSFSRLLELFTKSGSVGEDGSHGAPMETELFARDAYAHHIKWAMVLCASMRTRDPAFIDAVLSMSPDIKSCKPDTIDKHASDFEGHVNADRLSTPLSEAIENDLPEYIAICESLGALEILKTDKEHRVCAFEAAAAVGNVNYINKILSVAPICHQDPGALDVHTDEAAELGMTDSKDATNAMTMAILNNHKDAFYALFNAGVDVDNKQSCSPRTPDPLFAAVLMRNLPVVQTLLSAGGGNSSFSSERYYHSFSQPLKSAVPKLDGGAMGYVGCEFSSSHAHLEQKTSELLEEAVLWGRRDVLLGLKTLRPIQCLPRPTDEVMRYLANEPGMLDFLVEERMVDATTLERLMIYSFEKKDEELLNKTFELGACHGNGFNKGLEAGMKCPQLLRKVLDEHEALFPHHTCNFRGRGNSGRQTLSHPRGVNSVDVEVPPLWLGAEALIHALKLPNSIELEAERKQVPVRTRRAAVPNGPRVGREAAWVLLDAGLADVRSTRYSTTTMEAALDVHKEIVKKAFGRIGETGGDTTTDNSKTAEGAPRQSSTQHREENDDQGGDDVGRELVSSRQIISALLARGCHPDDPVRGNNDNAETTFLHAIATRDIEIVKTMILRGATINYPTTPEDSLINTHYRHKHPHYNAATLQSADDKRQFLSGLTRTPLQRAVEVNSAAIVELLLDPKDPLIPHADPNAPAAHRMGATALQLAAWQGNCGIAATLLAHGADINAPPCKLYGKSALEGAAEWGRLEMIDLLKGNGYHFELGDCKRSLKKAEEAGEGGCVGRIREILKEITVGIPT